MKSKMLLKLMEKEFNFHNFHLLINYLKLSVRDLNNSMVEDLVIMEEDLVNMEKEDMVAHLRTNLKRNVI